MKTCKITAMIHAPNKSETRLTVCEENESGEEDCYEDVTITHDSLGTRDEMMSDIDEYVIARQKQLNPAH
jgi:hypothetical protein